MKEEEKDLWAEGIAKAIVGAGEMMEGALKCRCGCDAELVKRFGDDVMLPVLRKLAIDYLEMRALAGMLGKMVGEEVRKDEGTTSGISTSGLH